MRLHSLTLEAFGPFPGREHVDFDALDNGILLVNGPTGSGKSSLLDAIAFALFGNVPGARRSLVQSLRSHHARPESAPRVELEFSVGTQRWKVERSPQWEAPKRRGSGTTTRQASVLLSQWRDGQWHHVSSRIDEAADMMSDTLGMKLDQFAQVVLLPQGEFAQFLRAKPEDRRFLLERLFDVARFEAVEHWFSTQKNDRLRASERSLQAIQSHMTVVNDAITRLADGSDESAGAPAPIEWEDSAVDQLPQALRDLLRTLTLRRDVLDARSHTREAWARGADRALESARLLAESRAAYAEATDVLDTWTEHAIADMRRQLDAAARVAGIVRLSTRVERAQLEAARANAQLDEATSRLNAHVVKDADVAWGREPWVSETFTSLTTALREVMHARRQTASATEAHESARRRLDARQADVDRVAEQLSTAATHLDDARTRATETEAAVTANPAPTALADAVARLRQDLAPVERRRQENERTDAAHTAAITEYAEAERSVLRLREARIAGIASELAQGLAPDEACPVCGSTTHPDPASGSDDTPTQDEIDAAQARAERANATRLDAAERRSAAQARWRSLHDAVSAATSNLLTQADLLTPAESRPPLPSVDDLLERPEADETLETFDALVATHRRAHETSQKSHHETMQAVSAGQEALADARSRDAAARTAHASAQEQLTTSQAALTEAWRALATTSSALPVVILEPLGFELSAPPEFVVEGARAEASQEEGDAPPAEDAAVTDWIDALTAVIEAALATVHSIVTDLTRFDAATRDETAARRAVRDATTELEDELVAKGYDSVESARAHAMDEDDAEQLSTAWHDAVQRRAAALAVTENPHVAAAAYVPAPDVNRLRSRSEILARRAREAHALAARWNQAFEVLDSMRHHVADAVREHLPLADAAREMNDLAATFSGGGDNTHKMRLTSYVLAAHLETVTAMANERLARMTDGRYQLRHTDERARGTQRSGLGLLVVDAWTGRSRDTATLSGGEAFMASLALALGLGDAVRADSGGMELHTLFVDEGFGSLDQDTLEHVMEVLDGLREGGRLVGVVSHVTELRARIPTHIEVRKTSEGSTIHTGDAIPIERTATA